MSDPRGLDAAGGARGGPSSPPRAQTGPRSGRSCAPDPGSRATSSGTKSGPASAAAADLPELLRGVARVLEAALDEPDREVEAELVLDALVRVTGLLGLVEGGSEPTGHGAPLEVLGLSPRAHGVLVRHGVATVGDLLRRSEHDLTRVRGLGSTLLREVQAKLVEHRRRIPQGELPP